MHEYAVTQNIVDVAVKEAQAANAGRILEIKLVIGDLSAIIDESVQMYFEIISKGTAAEGARLSFRRVPAGMRCKNCGALYDKPASGFQCPVCGGEGMLTGTGREFYIESMVVL